jgi:alkanesulfonate monooxygenase SsuD/methylene tetrahydromethanopterin reductase-like flavin-dependent oxidoreductase (luciferase family)
MHADLLFDPFGGRWDDLREAAVLAEAAGFDGLWLYDHLAGSAHRAAHVLECWTVLSALAAAVPRVTVGSLVLNVANRDPGTLAVMAATLQEVSGGRLLLGVGAGGGIDTP